MSDPNNDSPIGEPEPMEPGEARNTFEWLATGILVAVGGLVAFSNLVMPTRTLGATRSGRLAWQQRQTEVHKAAAATESGTTDGVKNDTAPKK